MKSKNHASRIGLLYILDLEVPSHGFACMRCRSSTDEPAAANEAEAWDWVSWLGVLIADIDNSSLRFKHRVFVSLPASRVRKGNSNQTNTLVLS